jgi:hypothetical protein
MPDGFQLLDTTGLAMQRTIEHVSRLSTEEAGSNTGNPVFVWDFFGVMEAQPVLACRYPGETAGKYV